MFFCLGLFVGWFAFLCYRLLKRLCGKFWFSILWLKRHWETGPSNKVRRKVTHLSTNPARRRVTSLMRQRRTKPILAKPPPSDSVIIKRGDRRSRNLYQKLASNRAAFCSVQVSAPVFLSVCHALLIVELFQRPVERVRLHHCSRQHHRHHLHRSYCKCLSSLLLTNRPHLHAI